jgi:L-serine dehydratase
VEAIRASRKVDLFGTQTIPFEESRDLVFYRVKLLPSHSNGMRFRAFDGSGHEPSGQVYDSSGGGFIEKEGEPRAALRQNCRMCSRPPQGHRADF